MNDTESHLAGADTPAPGPAREVIAKLAELIWEKAGRPDGCDVEFWLLAEAALKEAHRTPHTVPKPAQVPAGD